MPKPQESHRKDPAPASVPAEKASISFLSSGGWGIGWYREIQTRQVKKTLLAGFFPHCRISAGEFEQISMPDLAAMLVRSSIGTLAQADASCADCRRTPLAGERMHELDGGRVLCDLCFARLPEDRRRAVRTERVHASERRLSVVPRAA
jgi:hypothetical protein